MKQLLFIAFGLLLGITLILGSCSKTDTGDGTVPEIVILGLNPLYWAKDLPYEDEGAIAFDVTPEGDTVDITSSIVVTNNIDVTAIGDYIVNYNVKDASGMSAEEKVRKVKVVIGK